MNRWKRFAVLAPCLALGAGASHCRHGDDLVFTLDQCLSPASVVEEGGLRGPSPLPVVEMSRRYGGLYQPAEVRVVVSVCGAAVTRISNGSATTVGPVRVSPEDTRALHDELAAAGAGDLVGYTDCLATTGHDTQTEVTFFEPSLVPGRAWANRFGFGNCGLDPQATEVVRLLSRWVTEHIGPNLF